MFPSSGYFSSIPCPFFVNGLCERPYCHFRHSKHDVEKVKEDAPSHSTEDTTSSPTTSTSGCSSPAESALSSAAPQPEPGPVDADDVYFTSAQEEKPLPPPPSLSQGRESGAFSIPSFTDNSSKYQVPTAEEPEQYVTASPEKNWSITGPLALPTYLPTPKTPSLPAPQPVKADDGVPVYQPTPKRELKRRHGDDGKSKAKGTNIEYDPECNYSCGGLTNSSHEQAEQDDDNSYQPTKKKARVSSEFFKQRKVRLSCESLMASNPSLHSQSGDDMPEAQFSEEECGEEETADKTKNNSADFENIGDDDISSDDEFVDVPEDPLITGKKKDEGNTLVKPKASSSSEKTTKKSGGGKPDPDSVQQQQKPAGKDSSSKSSGSKQLLSSSSKESVKTKTDKSSSHNGITSSSVSDKAVKHGASKSSSSAKSTSSSKSRSADKSHLSSKPSSSKQSSKQEQNFKVKEHKSESPEKRSTSGKTSSSSNSHSSSSKKSSSSETKSSSSKHTVGKNEAVRQSSLGNKTSDNASHKHSNSDSKNRSRKHSNSDSKSDKRSVADSVSISSSGSKHSSFDSKKTKTSERGSHSKLSKSNRESSSIKGTSAKKSSSHSSKKDDSEKSSKEQKLHKRHLSSSSTSKHTDPHEKSQKPTSSLHSKKSSLKDANSNSKVGNRKVSEIERLNSNLFGDDSEDDNKDFSFSGTNGDHYKESCLDEPSAAKAAEEVTEVDYSSFIHDSDFEEEDTFDECLRIFKEEAPKKRATSQQKKLVKDLKAEDSSHPGTTAEIPCKKRVAHKLAEKVRKPELLKKERPRKILSATEVMHNRIMEMQRRALVKAANQVLQEQEVSSTSGLASKSQPGQGGEKKRVAHTPKPPPPAPKPKSFSVKTDGKGILNKAGAEPEKRVAHTPNLVNLKRPVIPASFGSKVPSNIRQRYLNLIIDECLKFCPNQEQAFQKGLEEETGVYERASNKNIYLRVAVNTITRLRAEAKEATPGSSKSQQRRSSLTQSHEATIGGSRAAKTSFTLHRSTASGKKEEVPLTAVELYQKLMKYTMAEQLLVDNGYPMPSPDTPGKAVVKGSRYQTTDTLLKGNERNCARCGTRFMVNKDGEYASSEDCVYHWSRAFARKKSGFFQHIYNCCGSDTSSKGCQVAANHVHEQNKWDSLTGFMRTMPRSPPRDGNFGIYALDCEMVYTLGGLELARVTVIDVEGETVYESLVQPFRRIADYNTRFSGLKAADLNDVKTTLTDVQAILLSLFSDKTILIGHSLESDLFALKLIHKTVVDTSVVFPHRLGPPYKRALKNLMLETFQKIIQCDDGGHDSKEDAMACLQLMKWRLKEDSRREQRYS